MKGVKSYEWKVKSGKLRVKSYEWKKVDLMFTHQREPGWQWGGGRQGKPPSRSSPASAASPRWTWRSGGGNTSAMLIQTPSATIDYFFRAQMPVIEAVQICPNGPSPLTVICHICSQSVFGLLHHIPYLSFMATCLIRPLIKSSWYSRRQAWWRQQPGRNSWPSTCWQSGSAPRSPRYAGTLTQTDDKSDRFLQDVVVYGRQPSHVAIVLFLQEMKSLPHDYSASTSTHLHICPHPHALSPTTTHTHPAHTHKHTQPRYRQLLQTIMRVGKALEYTPKVTGFDPRFSH